MNLENAWRRQSPRPFFFCWQAHFAAFNPLEKRSRQFALTWVALAMNGAEVKELVAEGIPFFVLGKDVLQRDGKLTQAGRFGPGILFVLVHQLREKPGTAVRTLVKTGQQLFAEDAAECFELIGWHGVARVEIHGFAFGRFLRG